ncbi:HEAT repeat domain-containing protein [Archangium minus]|uniref:HEAT repeat domain-containing protein n=1 Tax=Archangium minus TaxID=83450 RepID=A0ABY9WGL2_9BACT|nr:HEAT repeat domain-containing protein [Archangium minus]
MARDLDVKQWQAELVDACKYGEEAHAHALVLQPGPRKARALLEGMLEDPDALVRQAAAFGLGELGGAASARRLEQQLPLEESRRNHDGASVVEAITQALSRIEEAGSRATLVRRLQRLTPGKATLSEVNPLARALWRRHHPDLIPIVRKAVEQLALSELNSLQGLQLLLEKSPQELRAWVQDTSVPVKHKTEVLTVLEEEVPEAWVPTLSAFISTAETLLDTAVSHNDEAAYYCERLLILLLHQERVISALPPEVRTRLHTVARRLLAATSLNCATRAANMLAKIGRPEDAALLVAHRPAEPILAKSFDEAAHVLRHIQEG